MFLSMKVNVNKCLIIILASTIIGLTYNFVNPSGISLIYKQKEVKWASDSLVTTSLKPIDTLNNKVKTNPIIEVKTSSNKKSESINPILKSDSIKLKQL